MSAKQHQSRSISQTDRIGPSNQYCLPLAVSTDWTAIPWSVRTCGTLVFAYCILQLATY